MPQLMNLHTGICTPPPLVWNLEQTCWNYETSTVDHTFWYYWVTVLVSLATDIGLALCSFFPKLQSPHSRESLPQLLIMHSGHNSSQFWAPILQLCFISAELSFKRIWNRDVTSPATPSGQTHNYPVYTHWCLYQIDHVWLTVGRDSPGPAVGLAENSGNKH